MNSYPSEALLCYDNQQGTETIIQDHWFQTNFTIDFSMASSMFVVTEFDPQTTFSD